MHELVQRKQKFSPVAAREYQQYVIHATWPCRSYALQASDVRAQAVIRSHWREAMLLRFRVRRKTAWAAALQTVGEALG